MDELISRGKVKEVFSHGDDLKFKFTNNISIFDKVTDTKIPHKGEVLCRLSAHWLKRTSDIVQNHFIALQGGDEMVVRRFNILEKPTTEDGNFLVPLEFIVRHYVAGSLLDRIKKGKVDPSVVGLEGEVELGMKLPEPFFEVTTKFEAYDRPVEGQEALDIGGLTEEEMDKIKDAILAVDAVVAERAAIAGLVHVDGKKEFALDANRNPVLVDSFGTPDEDRFWDLAAHREGRFVDMSKEIARTYYRESGYHEELYSARSEGREEPPIPPLPDDIAKEVSDLYVNIFERLTGEEF
jgi:phosphoribosylaminoimidazole-succinocarboxamide synthase